MKVKGGNERAFESGYLLAQAHAIDALEALARAAFEAGREDEARTLLRAIASRREAYLAERRNRRFLPFLAREWVQGSGLRRRVGRHVLPSSPRAARRPPAS